MRKPYKYVHSSSGRRKAGQVEDTIVIGHNVIRADFSLLSYRRDVCASVDLDELKRKGKDKKGYRKYLDLIVYQ